MVSRYLSRRRINLPEQSSLNRAIDSFDHKKAFWYYGVTFWYSVAPWSILYITTIVIAIKKKLLTTDKEKLFLSAIASTFVILSMFSGKLDICPYHRTHRGIFHPQ